MKPLFHLLLGGLLAAGPAQARNPQPLRMKKERGVQIAHPSARVVLVHGFLENGDTFRKLRKRLEARNVLCLTPRLRPNDGRGGLNHLAHGLKRDIESAFGTDEPISIVAFSMGGLVSRHYLQHLGGAARCESFVTVSSPHHGTRAAWLYPSEGVIQMRPGSVFLRDLRRSESTLDGLRIASFRTPLDLIILPASSSVWERAENRSYPVALHPLMLSSRQVLDDIEHHLFPLPDPDEA